MVQIGQVPTSKGTRVGHTVDVHAELLDTMVAVDVVVPFELTWDHNHTLLEESVLDEGTYFPVSVAELILVGLVPLLVGLGLRLDAGWLGRHR